MKIEFENQGERYECDLGSGVSLARPIQFSASRPNPWNVSAPVKTVVTTDGFTGSTQAGGSCNVDQLSLIAHCHGTHTETIGHIVNSDHLVSDLSIPSIIPAIAVSVSPVAADSIADTYEPAFGPSDHVIAAEHLNLQLEKWAGFTAKALIVRTDSPDAFFTNEAMAAIVDAGVEHLLVDLPSVDRMEDDGLLTNHRIFWDVEAGCHETHEKSRTAYTITELIRVPDQVTDGPCLLSIQVPSVDSDAAPSRPVLYPIARI